MNQDPYIITNINGYLQTLFQLVKDSQLLIVHKRICSRKEMTLNKELKCQRFTIVSKMSNIMQSTYSYLGAIKKLLCNANTSNRNNTILILKEHLNKYIKLFFLNGKCSLKSYSLKCKQMRFQKMSKSNFSSLKKIERRK